MSAIDSFLGKADRWKPTTHAPSNVGDDLDIQPSLTSRPQRWDVPFSDNMLDETVEQLLILDPFVNVDQSRFPRSCTLRSILKNDTRMTIYEAGDVIVREGDYGNSAFLILSGVATVALHSLKKVSDQRSRTTKPNMWRAVAQLWANSKHREARHASNHCDETIGVRNSDGQSRVFLQDVPGVLKDNRTLNLNVGEFFGELAALSRSPRTATVFAQEQCLVLEIRWQGLRDIMRWDRAIQTHIHDLYRRNSLEAHLRETPFFQHLSSEDIGQIAVRTEFKSFGSFEWHQSSAHQHIDQEPLIAREGDYADAVYLVRTGFTRLSRAWGESHRTISYLGKGQIYGLAEIAHSFVHGNEIALQYSLRSLGYADLLWIPAFVIREQVLPALPKRVLDLLVNQIDPSRHPATINQREQIDDDLLNFVAEHRLMNGTQAMVIDLDRCVRCDDCVRACAVAHDNNPRFVRQGPVHGSLQFANACMHCVDPVCLIGCPTGAILRSMDSGDITVDDSICVGCGTCSNSCPYGNIQMVEITDQHGQLMLDKESSLPILKATKCDMCESQRVQPACQEACSHDALIRVNLSHPKGGHR